MKNIQTFEEFINESRDYTNKERIKDINRCLAQDAALKKQGIDGLKNTRAEVAIYKGDNMVSKMTDAEVKKLANELKNEWKMEDINSKKSASIYDKLEKMARQGNISISVMGDYVPGDLIVRFAASVLFNVSHYDKRNTERSYEEIENFLSNANGISITVDDRKVVDKWYVLYSGYIESEKDTLEFKDVENGIGRTLG